MSKLTKKEIKKIRKQFDKHHLFWTRSLHCSQMANKLLRQNTIVIVHRSSHQELHRKIAPNSLLNANTCYRILDELASMGGGLNIISLKIWINKYEKNGYLKDSVIDNLEQQEFYLNGNTFSLA